MKTSKVLILLCWAAMLPAMEQQKSDFRNYSEATSLFEYAKNSLLRVVKYLTKGADINAQDANKDKALICAAKNGWRYQVPQLISDGANIDASQYITLNFPLLEAAKNGHRGIVEFLGNNGADINAQDGNKDTALIWAAENGHLEVVKYLINHGADLDKQNLPGNKALDAALKSMNKYVEIVQLLEQAQAMKSQQSARNE